MTSREESIHTAMAISRRYGMSMDDAMMIAIESSMYNESPANETSYGSSLGLFDRIISALKRAIQFVIRVIRELIAKLTKDAEKKSKIMNKIAANLKDRTFESAKKIFMESSAILSKCKSYVSTMMGAASKVAGDVAAKRDSDLKVPESKVDPEVLSSSARTIQERAENLAAYSTEQEQKYAFDDKKIDFETATEILNLMPDTVRNEMIRNLHELETNYQSIFNNIEQIYKDCKNESLVDKKDRGKIETWCGKITRGTNHIVTSFNCIKTALYTKVKLAIAK